MLTLDLPSLTSLTIDILLYTGLIVAVALLIYVIAKHIRQSVRRRRRRTIVYGYSKGRSRGYDGLHATRAYIDEFTSYSPSYPYIGVDPASPNMEPGGGSFGGGGASATYDPPDSGGGGYDSGGCDSGDSGGGDCGGGD